MAAVSAAIPFNEAELVVHVVGARPNFVKMAPLIDALRRRGVNEQFVVHTGQHYDRKMSDEILEDLGFPTPDYSLGVGSGHSRRADGEGPHGVREDPPGTAAGRRRGRRGRQLHAWPARSQRRSSGIPVAHLEAGLRSGDWDMPEEINRVLTDRLSDILLTHSPEATTNLQSEGVDTSRVRYVGNTMIDSLRRYEGRARERAAWRPHGVEHGEYVLVTLHRPSNVDDPQRLSEIVGSLAAVGNSAPVIFPVHPRTRARLSDGDLLGRLESSGVRCIDPVGYLDFLSLQTGAGAIVTDSGGVQEEASALGVDCYTLRANTERPVTITHGTNELIGDKPAALRDVRLSGRPPTPCAIPLWDGHAADRAADALIAEFPAILADDLAALA